MGLMLVLSGITAQSGWLFVLAADVLGLVAGAQIARHRLGACSVERVLPARARQGDDVTEELVVGNSGRTRLPAMRLEDHHPALQPAAVVCDGPGGGASAHISLERTVETRGVYEGGSVTIWSGAPFGLMRSRRVAEVVSPLTVVPRAVELSSFPILEPSSYPSDAPHERARTGAGEEYLGVREYRPGDPRRSVHWRSSARAGHLVVREFEQHSPRRAAVVVAGADHGTPPESSFEALVSAAASIALYALRTGHPLDLIRQGQGGSVDHLADPDGGAALDWLAAVTPSDVPLDPLVAEAARRAGRGGTVVMLAPSAGRTGQGLTSAVTTAQAVGARPILVLALSSSWCEHDLGLPIEQRSQRALLGAGRVPLRTLSRGVDLAHALHG